jgi:hypothetical protein
VADSFELLMMTPGEKVIAVGTLSVMNTILLAISGLLGAGSLVASVPLATAIAQQ